MDRGLYLADYNKMRAGADSSTQERFGRKSIKYDVIAAHGINIVWRRAILLHFFPWWGQGIRLAFGQIV